MSNFEKYAWKNKTTVKEMTQPVVFRNVSEQRLFQSMAHFELQISMRLLNGF